MLLGRPVATMHGGGQGHSSFKTSSFSRSALLSIQRAFLGPEEAPASGCTSWLESHGTQAVHPLPERGLEEGDSSPGAMGRGRGPRGQWGLTAELWGRGGSQVPGFASRSPIAWSVRLRLCVEPSKGCGAVRAAAEGPRGWHLSRIHLSFPTHLPAPLTPAQVSESKSVPWLTCMPCPHLFLERTNSA